MSVILKWAVEKDIFNQNREIGGWNKSHLKFSPYVLLQKQNNIQDFIYPSLLQQDEAEKCFFIGLGFKKMY